MPSHVKVQREDALLTWVLHPPPVLLTQDSAEEARAEGLGWEGEGSKTPNCLVNPFFKRFSDSGLLPVPEVEGSLCMTICVGKAPPGLLFPHTQEGTALPGGSQISAQCCLCLGTCSAHPPPSHADTS